MVLAVPQPAMWAASRKRLTPAPDFTFRNNLNLSSLVPTETLADERTAVQDNPA